MLTIISMQCLLHILELFYQSIPFSITSSEYLHV